MVPGVFLQKMVMLVRSLLDDEPGSGLLSRNILHDGKVDVIARTTRPASGRAISPA